MLEQINLPDNNLDSHPTSKTWVKNYTIEIPDEVTGPQLELEEFKNGITIYSDGSKMDNQTGFGAVIYQQEQEMACTHGNMGFLATDFQAECYGLQNGIDLAIQHFPGNEPLQFYIDNQALLLALHNPKDTTYLIHETRKTLNTLGEIRKLTLNWTKAHVGTPGNERADVLAKEGTQEITQGCEPMTPLSLAVAKWHIRTKMQNIWTQRWENGPDARQTRIFFPKPDPKRAKSLSALPRNQYSKDSRARLPKTTPRPG
jgi:ribonuclease HI